VGTTTSATRSCPKCGFEQAEGLEACELCGVIFAKIPAELPGAPSPAAAAGPSAAPASDVLPTAAPHLSTYDLALLGGGLLAAILLSALPFTRFVLSALVTLLHELGHAAVAWALGCPAVPAFDLVYGGGVTYHQSFEPPLAVLVGGLFVAAGWWLRRRPRAVVAVAILGLVWLLIVVSPWRRSVAISAAGHAAEMLFAGLFLWMALSGVGWRSPEVERPLGSFVAFFVSLHTLAFASRLRSDDAYLAEYLRGKGGALMNDLEHVALDLKIWLGVETSVPELAGWILLLTPLTLATALALHVLRRRAYGALVWLLEER
jgi:hypothetical protein